MSTIVFTGIGLLFLSVVVWYIWPRPEVRFEKILIATFGAFVGSLIGRVWVDPSGWPHVMFVAGGAFVFSCVDWVRRSHRASSGSVQRLDDHHRRG
jgi:hypothetical protein